MINDNLNIELKNKITLIDVLSIIKKNLTLYSWEKKEKKCII